LRIKFLLAVLALLLLGACRRRKPELFTDILLEPDHACGQVLSGAIVCWGGTYGDVPRVVPEMKALPPRSPLPVEKVEGRPLAVAHGRDHACAILHDGVNEGTVWCWGDNSFHQVADGTTERRDRPVRVQGLFGVTQVVTAADGTCVRLSDGDVRCWGNNTHGQLAPRFHPRTVVNVPTSVLR
jgi:hypothetical protein